MVALLREPILRETETLRGELIGADPADFFRANQPASFEHAEMFDKRRQRHFERLREFGNRRGPLTEAFEDMPAGGVRQGTEDTVDGRSCLNRVRHAGNLAGANT